MTFALLLLALSAEPAKKPADDAPKAATLTPATSTMGAGDTKCAACHVTSNWSEVRFNHDKTGFPLHGAHAATSCKECHTVDFQRPVPRGCVGCHTDVHQGELGARCEGCHDEDTFRSRIDIDAHRRTAFPLLGGHATLPCTQCHLEAGTRQFSRSTIECGSCHATDFQRTRSTAVNHVALGFDAVECRNCHGALSFKPARFPEHDRCLVISVGGHAGMPCANCHQTLSAVSSPGSCSLPGILCTECHSHTHDCTGANGTTPTDQIHKPVWPPAGGYSCKDLKCAQCHKPQ